MGSPKPGWFEGFELLRRRQSALPEAVLRAWSSPIDLSPIDFSRFRGVVTTGIGSSSAHAQYLAWLLRRRGVSSWSVSSGAFFTAPGDEAREQALVVFSQGMSPNARLPLFHADRFGCTILVTAAGAERGERSAALRIARESGVLIVPMPVDPEYDVLLRLVGPIVGYVLALRLSGYAETQGPDAQSVASAITAAAGRTEVLLSTFDPSLFSDPITFVATGGYAALASNLCSKVAEGMFLPPPLAVDAMEFAHGFLQEASGKRRTLIALTRGAAHEPALLERVRSTLEPQHAWLELKSTLPEPLQIFEHESAMNVVVLGAIAARYLDQREWPGKGRDGPLYSISSPEDLLHIPIAEREADR